MFDTDTGTVPDDGARTSSSVEGAHGKGRVMEPLFSDEKGCERLAEQEVVPIAFPSPVVRADN